MRDQDIRQALHASELNAHRGEPDTLVLDELGICQGDFRVDIAVVNGSLHGIEIKSNRDTLSRLPAQAEAYSRVFDSMCIVAGCTHVNRVSQLVPDWWGIRVAESARDGVTFHYVRQGEQNQGVDPAALVQLLWRDETLALLNVHGGARGLRGKSRDVLWSALSDRMSHDDLRRAVRQQLKARQGWR